VIYISLEALIVAQDIFFLKIFFKTCFLDLDNGSSDDITVYERVVILIKSFRLICICREENNGTLNNALIRVSHRSRDLFGCCQPLSLIEHRHPSKSLNCEHFSKT
jgi:hypothetical protein